MVDCIQEPDGRWRWIEILPGAEGFQLGRGYVTFATEAEAREDLAVHLQARHDHTGRVSVPLGHLEVLVRVFAQSCPTCGHAYPERIFWHPRDADGCNWSIAAATGDSRDGCADARHRDPNELRRVYALAGDL